MTSILLTLALLFCFSCDDVKDYPWNDAWNEQEAPEQEKPEQPEEPETPADPDEDQKDEEQTMPDEKPQEQPENEPAEAPKKIELSGKVMSLITIMLTCALVYMVIFSIDVPDFFQKCYLLILTTFFTKGTAKAITDK